MRIGVLGTGIVARTLAARLAELGNEVVVGTRDVQATLSRTGSDAMGNPPYKVWQADHPQVSLQTFAGAAAGAELVVNATAGGVSIEALELAGAEHLDGKVLLDVANHLDASKGFPPTVVVKEEGSLAEQIQRAFPGARVVKALNTMTAAVMVDPAKVASGNHTVFVAGDDAAAKGEVVELLRSFGWADIIDLGDLSGARGAEMLLPIWLRLMGTLGGPAFNFKIAR